MTDRLVLPGAQFRPDGEADARDGAAPPCAPADLVVRPATASDHPAVLALLRALDLDWPARDLAWFVVAESRGEVVGIAELRDLGGRRLLSCVGVREDLQGRGLGRELVRRALDGVAEDVWLYTVVPGFFAKLGFEVEPAQPRGVPPRSVYGCEACTPSRCRRMVRRRTGGGPPAAEPLRAEHLSALSALLARDGEPTCDLSAAGLWIWRDCDRPRIATVGGATCLRLEPHHEAPYFLEPLGGGDLVATAEVCARSAGRLSRVRAECVGKLPPDRFDAVPVRAHFDYVCDRRGVADLRGREHDGRRNRIRKFSREHPRHEVRALTPSDRDAALALFDGWAQADERAGPAPDAPPVPSRACQRHALGRAFEDLGCLGLVGGALVEDGALLGFLVASRAGDTATVHLQYADTSLPGAVQTLFVECCRGVLADAAWVNLEEDLGIPGLRRTKLSWRPARLVEKFDVTLR